MENLFFFFSVLIEMGDVLQVIMLSNTAIINIIYKEKQKTFLAVMVTERNGFLYYY